MGGGRYIEFPGLRYRPTGLTNVLAENPYPGHLHIPRPSGITILLNRRFLAIVVSKVDIVRLLFGVFDPSSEVDESGYMKTGPCGTISTVPGPAPPGRWAESRVNLALSGTGTPNSPPRARDSLRMDSRQTASPKATRPPCIAARTAPPCEKIFTSQIFQKRTS